MAKKRTMSSKRKKPAKKTTKKTVNKTQAIRDALSKDPNASPKELAGRLSKQGVKVTPAYVSTIKHSLSKRTGKKAVGRPKAKRIARSNDNVSLSGLVETKRFVEKVGGANNAKDMIDALSRLT